MAWLDGVALGVVGVWMVGLIAGALCQSLRIRVTASVGRYVRILEYVRGKRGGSGDAVDKIILRLENMKLAGRGWRSELVRTCQEGSEVWGERKVRDLVAERMGEGVQRSLLETGEDQSRGHVDDIGLAILAGERGKEDDPRVG